VVCLALGTGKKLKQFLLWSPDTYNGQRPVGVVCYSVFGKIDSKEYMHFSHVL